jgi:hypothetical protein
MAWLKVSLPSLAEPRALVDCSLLRWRVLLFAERVRGVFFAATLVDADFLIESVVLATPQVSSRAEQTVKFLHHFRYVGI